MAAGTDELFVSGFPPWCTVMVLPQAFVWLFFQVPLRWYHGWINVSSIFDDVFSTGFEQMVIFCRMYVLPVCMY